MPLQPQNPKLTPNPMAPKNLKRHNSRILQAIADNFAVKNLEGPVIARIGEKR